MGDQAKVKIQKIILSQIHLPAYRVIGSDSARTVLTIEFNKPIPGILGIKFCIVAKDFYNVSTLLPGGNELFNIFYKKAFLILL